MKKLIYLFLLALVGCSSTKVVYDYDTKVDFNQYKTFNFFKDVGEGLNELDIKRITTILENKLSDKGIRKAENPDFFINIISKKSPLYNDDRVGVGIGGTIGGNIGIGISGGIPIGNKKLNQQITIDFVESKNNQLIWQGIADAKVNEKMKPQKRIATFTKIIEEILKGYPPKK